MKNHSLITLGVINTLCLAGFYVHSQTEDKDTPKSPVHVKREVKTANHHVLNTSMDPYKVQ